MFQVVIKRKMSKKTEVVLKSKKFDNRWQALNWASEIELILENYSFCVEEIKD